MDSIFMIHVNEKKDLMEHSNIRGAFRTYRVASSWLIEEGFLPYFNDELTEKYEEETLTFEKISVNDVTETALIYEYSIND